MKALILKECLKLSYEGAGVIAEVGSAVAEGAAWFDRLYRQEPGLLKAVLKPQ